MEQHLSPAALARWMTGRAAAAEAEIADAHVSHCPPCRDLAATVVAELRRNGVLVGPPDGRNAVLLQLEMEERTARRRLLAHGRWAELKKLAMEEQTGRLETEPELQTLEMFETIVADAAAVSEDDTLLGEERAFAACALAGFLPGSCCPEAARRDLQGRAMLVAVDCRRRAGASREAAAALKVAHAHFKQGTGDPVWEARLLSVQASLAAGTGHLERARACLSRASGIFRAARNPAAVASVEIQAAETLLAAGRPGQALEHAEDALRWLPPGEYRLETRAKSLAAECRAGLGQPARASAPRPFPARPPAPDVPRVVKGLDGAIEHYERQLIAAGLAQCNGGIEKTARLLGVVRNTLKTKIQKYGLAEDSIGQPPNAQAGPLALPETGRRPIEPPPARSLWEELRQLPAARQIERIESTPSLQTLEMFETVVAAAAACALEDPSRGEETALVAQALAGLLPGDRCPEPVRHDLLSETLKVIGNCRRLSGDWPASAAAFDEASSHLGAGSGDPLREARLLSYQASLASDTGKLEQALNLLARADAIYRRAQGSAALPTITLQKASALLSGGRYEEAMFQAEESLRGLPQRETRLDVLARSVIIECLALLDRPTEALRALGAAWPLYQEFRGRRSEPELAYLEALVLASLGYIDEAESAFNRSVVGYMEADLYKDAFLSMLTRFETLFRRGAWNQAARVCEEALALEKQLGAPGHAQMIELWRDLLILVQGQRLTEQRVLAARHALIRRWSVPQAGAPAASPGTMALRWDGNGSAAPMIVSSPNAAGRGQEARLLTIEPPTPPGRLTKGEYKEAIESYERRLIEAGLACCGGRIKPTVRLLGISRTKLQSRIKQYGLKTVA